MGKKLLQGTRQIWEQMVNSTQTLIVAARFVVKEIKGMTGCTL